MAALLVLSFGAGGCVKVDTVDESAVLAAPADAGLVLVIPVGVDRAKVIATRALADSGLTPKTSTDGAATVLLARTGMDYWDPGSYVRVRVESVSAGESRVACYGRRLRTSNYGRDRPRAMQANVLYRILVATLGELRHTTPAWTGPS